MHEIVRNKSVDRRPEDDRIERGVAPGLRVERLAPCRVTNLWTPGRKCTQRYTRPRESYGLSSQGTLALHAHAHLIRALWLCMPTLISPGALVMALTDGKEIISSKT